MKTFLQISFFFLLVTQMCFVQWVQLGLDDKAIKEIAARNSTIFALATDGALYRSTNNGITWSQIIDSCATDIAVTPSGLWFMIRGYYSQQWYEQYDSLYKSSDNVNTWVNLNIMAQLPLDYGLANVTVSPVGFVFCGLFKFEPYGDIATRFVMSTDDGFTWTEPTWRLGGDIFDFRGQSVITSGYLSMGSGMHINDACEGFHEANLSSDNGQTWLYFGAPPNWSNNVLSMFLNGNVLMRSSGVYPWDMPGLFISSDSCRSWIQVSTIIPNCGLSIESSSMLVGTDNLGVFMFSDNGDSLGSFNEGLTNLNIQSLAIDNNDNLYIGTDNGVWRRPLSEVVPVELTSFTALANGEEVTLSWSTATELNNYGFEIQRKALNGVFATVAFVKGQGTTTQKNDYSFADKNLDQGKYSYRLKQVDLNGKFEYSNIVEVEVITISSYSLGQNFPNPFNPSTTISYGLKEKSNVRLTILNSIGGEVAILVNEEQDKGYHKVEFDGSKLSSGVYFYKLVAKDFVSTKKMMLVK